MILELLSAGMTIEEILDDYEDLVREDIVELGRIDYGGPVLAIQRRIMVLDDDLAEARRVLDDVGESYPRD